MSSLHVTKDTNRRPAAPIAAAIEELSAWLGDRISTAPSTLEQHGTDESHHTPVPPDAVAYAESTEEVSRILACCHRHDCPVIPFGAGTSLEGHVAALEGGISLDLSRMDRVLEIHPDDLDCRVEAGVTRQRLNRLLAEQGLFFPVDPGAEATFGGMAATRASGTNAVRYGTMRENVLGLTVVLADGRIIRTGGRARTSAAGYDLTRLFVGSEGTLGVFTEVQLRLYGLPETILSSVCPFQDLRGAVQMAIETVQMGIPVARIELLDEVAIDSVNRYSNRSDPVKPTLFLELHGSEASVRDDARSLDLLAAEHGGLVGESGGLRWSSDAEEREALWHARHHAYWAGLALRPGSRGWPTDVCVPVSRLADCLLETRRDLDASGLLAPILGHVGDGNFHVNMVLDPGDGEELERAETVNQTMVERALAMGGTCTGEHGVGHGKIHCVEKEHGDAVEVMRRIKQALDPTGILNPGKIFRAGA